MCVDESQADEDEVLWLEFPSRPMLMTWARVYGDGALHVGFLFFYFFIFSIQLHV